MQVEDIIRDCRGQISCSLARAIPVSPQSAQSVVSSRSGRESGRGGRYVFWGARVRKAVIAFASPDSHSLLPRTGNHIWQTGTTSSIEDISTTRIRDDDEVIGANRAPT